MRVLYKVIIGICLINSITLRAGKREVMEVINRYTLAGKLNGAVLVGNRDEVLCDTAVGWSDKEQKILNTNQTLFYGASITKTFTAVSVAQLVSQGQLAYTDKIKTYLPELGAYANNLTIHQLLTHTSGLPDYEVEMPASNDVDTAIILQWLERENRLNFTPGSQHKYCNTGYILLAKIIERISGVSYEQYLTQHIFSKSGMQNTKLSTDKHQKGKEVAVGYDKSGNVDDFTLISYGDTGLLMTASDLYRYAKSLSKEEVLPYNQRELMYTSVKLTSGKEANYGYGWRVVTKHNHKTVYHKGGLNGFKSILWRDLEDGTIIVILTNYGDVLPTDALVEEFYLAAQK
ncbi:serine hydrolase domain-containing protein [Myroides sp.]|uniref:serine hydrolase domain-containing protein n=1 Tax=Myroides sp. TaxID=1874736 RepID=UPI003F3C5EA1